MILEILDQSMFIRKIIPESVASLMGLTVGSSISALWDVKTCNYRIVRIVKQAHSDPFHLHGLLAMKLNSVEKSGHQVQLKSEEFDDSTFCLQNGEFVRLSAHEFEETDDENIFAFAAVPRNQINFPFDHEKLLKMKGPHMIVKVLSLTGDNVRLLRFACFFSEQRMTSVTELRRVALFVEKRHHKR